MGWLPSTVQAGTQSTKVTPRPLPPRTVPALTVHEAPDDSGLCQFFGFVLGAVKTVSFLPQWRWR